MVDRNSPEIQAIVDEMHPVFLSTTEVVKISEVLSSVAKQALSTGNIMVALEVVEVINKLTPIMEAQEKKLEELGFNP